MDHTNIQSVKAWFKKMLDDQLLNLCSLSRAQVLAKAVVNFFGFPLIKMSTFQVLANL